MYLENLKIKNFRNYEDQDLDFDKNTILIIGDNGKGKTNLLESIYYISAGKSHRTNKPEELIKWDDDFTVIRATVSDRSVAGVPVSEKHSKHLVEVQLGKNNSIKIKVDRVFHRKKSDFVSILPSVIFSPDDLRILKGGPSNRRNFLDGVIEKVQKNYQGLCIKYQKVLNQRNSLLKTIVDVDRASINPTLETWDENLVRYGSEIIHSRFQLLSGMQNMFSMLIRRFFPEVIARIFYIYSWERKNFGTNSNDLQAIESAEAKNTGDQDLDHIRKRFSQILRDNLANDLNYRSTMNGPHRDDFMVVFNGRDIKSFGSQGQQRVAAICLRLCELEILKEWLDKKPVLLLDDVLSELDAERAKLLLEIIDKKHQTFITTASPDIFSKADTGSIEKYKIENNKVKKVF